MNDRDTRPPQLEALLSQDSALAAFPFEEFQMNLQKSISDLQARARKIRRASLVGLGIFIACVVAIFVLQFSGLQVSGSIAIACSVCGTAAMLVTGVLSALYQYRYQPALARSKEDLQMAMIRELQQQVAELRRGQERSK